jgi:hypothetical protein
MPLLGYDLAAATTKDFAQIVAIRMLLHDLDQGRTRSCEFGTIRMYRRPLGMAVLATSANRLTAESSARRCHTLRRPATSERTMTRPRHIASMPPAIREPIDNHGVIVAKAAYNGALHWPVTDVVGYSRLTDD